MTPGNGGISSTEVERTGANAVNEFRQASANSLRRLGALLVPPLVAMLYVIEVWAGHTDIALHLELAITLAGAVVLLAMRRSSARVTGFVGTAWFMLVLVAAEVHYGLTAGLAVGWMAVAIASHVFFRWRGSVPAIAIQLVVTLGLAALLATDGIQADSFSRFGVADPLVLVRMALVVTLAMGAMAVAHEHLLTRLEQWQQRAGEARARLRQAEREHARAVADMENLARLESVGRVASGVAHDINNALTIIMGNAELLSWSSRDESEDLRQEILVAATSASRTAAQLMNLARGGPREDEESVGRLVAALSELMRRLLPSDIAFIVEDTSTRDVRVDALRFQQVLLHLIANARDAISGSGTVTVRVADAPGDAGVILSVADTGRGWDLEAVARAFDPPDAHMPGMGLGPTRDLTVRHGGTVEIDSTPGHGTIITLHFGREPQVTLETPRTAEAIAASGVRKLPGLESLRGRPVLVAEDEESVRRLVVAYLKDSEANLTVVSNAVEARAAILREPFDLFITDAVMPGGGTTEAIQEFRRRNRRGHVLVVSGHVREDLLRRGIESGTVAFLPKPFTRVQLLDAVSHVIQRTARRPPA